MANEMTLQEIGERLDAIQGDIRGLLGLKGDVLGLKGDVQGLKGDVQGLKGDLQGLKGDVETLKQDLGSLRHEMKVQFEETHRLLEFGFEARESLRESMESRFDDADKKHDQQMELLKDVLLHVRRRVDRIEPRRRR